METLNTKNVYLSDTNNFRVEGFPIKSKDQTDDYFIPWLREDPLWNSNLKNLRDCCNARQLKFLGDNECSEEIDIQLSIPTEHPDSENVRIRGISGCQKLQEYWINWFASVSDKSEQGTIRLWDKWRHSVNSLSQYRKNNSVTKICKDTVHPLFVENGMVPYLPIDGVPFCDYTWRAAICGGDGNVDLHHPYVIPFTENWWMSYINAKVVGKKVPAINPVWFNRMHQEYSRGFRIPCVSKVLSSLSVDWPGVSFGAIPAGVITFNSSSPCTGLGDLNSLPKDVKRWKIDSSEYKTPYLFTEKEYKDSEGNCLSSVVPIESSMRSSCFCKSKLHTVNDITIREYTLSENCQ